MFLCPYCLHELRKTQIRRCCDLNHAHIMKSNTFLMRDLRCREPGCTGAYTELLCPECNRILPTGFTEFNGNIRFALVAPSGAGKSNYLTVMMRTLVRSGLRYNCIPQAGSRRQFNENINKLYVEHEAIPPSPPGTVIPQQWVIQDLKNAHGTVVPSYSLTVFDGAGEDLEKDQFDPKICRYLKTAKVVFLLLDPSQLLEIRSTMTQKSIKATGNMDYSGNKGYDIIATFAEYLKKTTRTKVNCRLKTPVAVILGKMDVWENEMAGMSVMQPSRHIARRAFIRNEADTVSAEVQSWLEMHGENQIAGLLDANFETWRFFGVSAFGQMPEDNKAVPREIRPVRVLDPLMWVLSLESIIPQANS